MQTTNGRLLHELDTFFLGVFSRGGGFLVLWGMHLSGICQSAPCIEAAEMVLVWMRRLEETWGGLDEGRLPGVAAEGGVRQHLCLTLTAASR